MFNNLKISLQQIIAEIYSDDLMRECPVEFIVNKTVELIGVCGLPTMFEDKYDYVKIHNYKGFLPCDFYEMNLVVLCEEPRLDDKYIGKTPPFDDMDKTTPYEYNTYGIWTPNGNIRPELKDKVISDRNFVANKVFVYHTGTFDPSSTKYNDLVYTIKGDVIHTSIDDGFLYISYKAFAVDDDGYPLIVNNYAFRRALVTYITLGWYKRLFAKGEIHLNVVLLLMQDYDQYISNAIGSMNTPTIDLMESISRMMNSILIRQDSHSTTFNDIHHKEEFKKH